MKTFSCGQVVPGCTATFHGRTDDDILAEVAAHARVDHHLDTIPTVLIDQVRRHITAA